MAIGGHSLGGVCSSWYVKDFPDKMQGVVLWAAYGFSEGSIQDRDIAVIVIFGTKDGFAHFIPNTIGSRPLFPAVLISLWVNSRRLASIRENKN